MADRLFVIISGLPGSGKTTLGRGLASRLNLPLIDKDDILERLYESKGVGDAGWRRSLSRESDMILQTEANTSHGAVLVSFWRLPGMPSDSGTPTDWLAALSNHVVNVHCDCEPELAASRFLGRTRHPGHLDEETSSERVLAGLRELAGFGAIGIAPRLHVDTAVAPDLDGVARGVRELFGRRVYVHRGQKTTAC